MISLAVIEELTARLLPPSNTPVKIPLIYFFCQADVPHKRTAISVIRGLIFMLVETFPAVIHHLRKRYDSAKKTLFEDHDPLHESQILLEEILADSGISLLYIVIDALDECIEQQMDLLNWIVRCQETLLAKVKWVLTSRNEPKIREILTGNDRLINTSLELNDDKISYAVKLYVDHKVGELAKKKRYSPALHQFVKQELFEKSENTFLWVALVCDSLTKLTMSREAKVRKALDEIPKGLHDLYKRMKTQIELLEDEEDKDCCIRLLSFQTVAYSPVSTLEIGHLAGLSLEIAGNVQDIEGLLAHCGSFVAVRNGLVEFVHLSAREFCSGSDGFVGAEPENQKWHCDIINRALSLMERVMEDGDIYVPRYTDLRLDQIDGDLIRRISWRFGYACLNWLKHFIVVARVVLVTENNSEMVHRLDWFLKTHLLRWLEAVIVLQGLPQIAYSVQTFESILDVSCGYYESYQLLMRLS